MAASAISPEQAQKQLAAALAGDWVGTLKYRDYSEPAGSTKRVKLPTWLSISAQEETLAGQPAELHFHYVCDDGPAKTVTDDEQVSLDLAAARYTVTPADGKHAESYTISGLDRLRQGRGTLVLDGSGIKSDAPARVRLTVRVGRNILEVLRETAPAVAMDGRIVGRAFAGSQFAGEPLTFRHAYIFVRRAAPAVAAQAPSTP